MLAAGLILALALALATGWATLALWHRAPAPSWAWAAGFALAAFGCLVLAWRLGPPLSQGWPALVAFLALLAVVMGWWSSLRPSGGRVWAEALSRLPSVTVEGERYTITNVRNFTWRATVGDADEGSGEEVAEARWETRSYDLSKAAGIDLFFSYWTGPLIAHVLVSVTFDDAPPLTFSIEIRRERGEVYSALAGFFKSYELAIIAADERDIVRLRTDVWKEDVRLYRLDVGRDKARALLLAYADQINALKREPRWYDTLGANCSTVAFRIARGLWPGLRFDWRILAPGRGPDYAHELGALRSDIPLDELKRLAAITEKAQKLAPDADFSAAIREGVPGPRGIRQNP
ncbi:MAG: DUF4105 domain-containing protein [Bosea sp.]|jgi:hypothetical protein|nr:DUF4105 domain-containing protein [Bosea sp. (in: a-proteobacteria)]